MNGLALRVASRYFKAKNMSDITSKFFQDVSPEDINRGRGWGCNNWAYFAFLTYGGSLCTAGKEPPEWPISWHAFLRLGSSFYDSTHPNGVNDWHTLVSDLF